MRPSLYTRCDRGDCKYMALSPILFITEKQKNEPLALDELAELLSSFASSIVLCRRAGTFCSEYLGQIMGINAPEYLGSLHQAVASWLKQSDCLTILKHNMERAYMHSVHH